MLIEAELTGRIRQVAFEVHRYFGSGFLERVYENSLSHRLRSARIEVVQQHPLDIFDEDGTVVGHYSTDLLIPGKLVIEVKGVRALIPEHEAQLIHLLQCTRLPMGLLINFGGPRLQFRRYVWTPGSTSQTRPEPGTLASATHPP